MHAGPCSVPTKQCNYSQSLLCAMIVSIERFRSKVGEAEVTMERRALLHSN